MTASNFRKNKKKLGSHYRRTSNLLSVSHLSLIDEINILNASIKAMQECVLKLEPQPEYYCRWKHPLFIKWNKNKAGKNLYHSRN
jgi:ribonuclease HII